MAKAPRKKRRSRSKNKKSKPKKKGQIPINVLEKRLGKLNRIVAKRGGDAYAG